MHDLKPPNLRTVGIQRISSLGVDFVVKQGSFTATRIGSIPVSLLVQTGRYVYGETAEQWRAEGHCEVLPLTDIVDALPEYTVTHMVAARRLREEFPYFDHSVGRTCAWTCVVFRIQVFWVGDFRPSRCLSFSFVHSRNVLSWNPTRT